MAATPRVVAIAGPNGAGKSTVAKQIVRSFGIDVFVNADTVATGLSALAPEREAVAAGRIVLQQMRRLAASRESFAFETTLASRTYARMLRGMSDLGFAFHLVYLWLPSADMAVSRVAGRVSAGGHDIPEPVIRRRFDRSLDYFFNIYRPLADSWIMLDNSSATAPTPVAWHNVGGPLRILKSGPWERLRRQYEKDVLQS
jgi:predicted ABC-type ATPase